MTRFGFAVEDRFPQDLTVRVRGADVLALERLASPEAEAPIPDLGELFVAAARAGLFGGARTPPWDARAEVLESSASPEEAQASWRLRLGGVDPGTLRILANVLRARDLDEISIATAAPAAARAAPALLDLARLAYPRAHGPLPFTLEAEPPLHASKDRSVQLVFLRPPPDAVVDEVLAAFGLWTNLLLLGGYPEDGTDPRESGAFPDPPFQLDALTVEQAFPELFAADEAAFDAIVNHALTVHQAGHGIANVVVR